MKKILVTGGVGFQGSHLVKSLRKKYDVIVLNTYSQKSIENAKSCGIPLDIVVWGSITDKGILDKTIRDVDLVVHAAANIHVEDSISNPEKYFEVNVLGTNNILELCRKRNIPMIHISSCEVYGGQDGILTEWSAMRPNSPYASSKASADVMCYSYYKTYGTRVNIVRPCNVYGIGQKDGLGGAVIPRFVKCILNNESISVNGDGEQFREFIFVEDLINAYELIIEETLKDENFKGNIFNIGSGDMISIIDLAKTMIEITNSNSEINHNVPRLGEVMRFELDSTLFKKHFSWNPKNNIKEGLKKYIKWIKDNE